MTDQARLIVEMTQDPELEAMARAICQADKLAPDPDAPIGIGYRTAKAWEGRVEMARAARDASSVHRELEVARAEIDTLRARLAYALKEFRYIGSEECCVVDLAKKAAGDGAKACDLGREFVG